MRKTLFTALSNGLRNGVEILFFHVKQEKDNKKATDIIAFLATYISEVKIVVMLVIFHTPQIEFTVLRYDE